MTSPETVTERGFEIEPLEVESEVVVMTGLAGIVTGSAVFVMADSPAVEEG